MLQTSAIEPGTLAALKKLMKIPSLKDFSLVGGTALALINGHRLSIDIDLFSPKIPFNGENVIRELKNAGKLIIKDSLDYALFLEFEGVKLDILKYQYAWLKPPSSQEGIRIATVDDIMAMKLSAVTKRGLKKDFYDIYFLLEEYPIDVMLANFKKKYSTEETYMVLKSMVYFEDAEDNENPVLLKEKKLTWEKVKKTIRKAVKETA